MPRIAQESIDRVLAASDVVDVIGSYFPLKRSGSGYSALCPFHREKTPSFHVNPQRQNYHCFGCGASGSIFRFVMEYESVDFPEAVQRLAQRAGIPLVMDAGGEDDRQQHRRRKLLELHRFAADWFMEQLLENRAGAGARQYLRARGFNREIAERWKIGYAPPGWDQFTNAAKEAGFKTGELITSGLAAPRNADRPDAGVYDRFRDRAMFSICNDVGEVVAFSGRLLQTDAKAAKYVNSPETPLFKKGQILFGLHQTKRPIIDAECAILCEGQIDLIRMVESGIPNVVAPQGTAFTEQQARSIKRLAPRAVLLFDADSAGNKAAEAAFRLLVAQTVTVHLATLPVGSDPDAFIIEEGVDALQEVIDNAPEFFDYQLVMAGDQFDLRNARGRLDAARHLAGLLTAVDEPILIDSMIQSASSRLSIAPNDIRRLVQEASRRTFSRAAEPEPEVKQPPVKLDEGSATLSVIVLQRDEGRRWMLAQPWREVIDQVEEGDVLRLLLEGDFEPGNEASIHAFLAQQPAHIEAALSSTLVKNIPESPMQVLEECWLGLRRKVINQRLQILKNRQRSELSAESILAVQKEILDLQKDLIDIAQLLTRDPSGRSVSS